MATKVWKGVLNFGLLSIPVYLNVAARDKKVEFHNYHHACKQQIKKPNWCPQCQTRLEASEIFRGYPSGDGIIAITDDELEAITPATGKVMEISQCVPQKDVDPIYYAESFFLLPDTGGNKAYSLLTKSLAETGSAAIAQLCKSSREHMVIIRPKANGLMLHFCWYPDEIADVTEFNHFQPSAFSTNELKLAKQLVESISGDFNPEQFEDGYRQRLNTLIASKLDKTIAAPAPVKESRQTTTVDIAAALEASLVNRPKRKVVPQDAPRDMVAGIVIPKPKKAGRGKGKAA